VLGLSLEVHLDSGEQYAFAFDESAVTETALSVSVAASS
jgi:hypothetical protein